MKKVVIVGVSASGKSYFARDLSRALDIPLYHMDTVMWRPGWEYVGDDATAQELDRLSQQNEWIIEGYITTDARTFLFDRADVIIHLDYSRFVCAWRYLKRWWKHRRQPRPEMEGSPESFSFKFLWLVWTKGEDRLLKQFLMNADSSKLVTLQSPAEAREFVAEYEKSRVRG